MLVREHPAPSGALRPVASGSSDDPLLDCQGAPSTIRCIETQNTGYQGRFGGVVREHPAPSGAWRHSDRVRADVVVPVREHPAPSGALRQHMAGLPLTSAEVREQAAPSGALRQNHGEPHGPGVFSQGAGSTIRCIETLRGWR